MKGQPSSYMEEFPFVLSFTVAPHFKLKNIWLMQARVYFYFD
jgi:hypothetical protein